MSEWPDLDHIVVLARTIWGEARGEGQDGMLAVAAVIRNRVGDGRWGDTYAEVCLQPFQFSCWNENDPNRPLLESVDFDDPAYRTAFYAATVTALALAVDPTNQANHYLAPASLAKMPTWYESAKVCHRHGRHEFLRL